MQKVFVLDRHKQPLDPCNPARARKLLRNKKAAVYRHFPFTIILKDGNKEKYVISAYRMKIDSGSKTTGIAVVSEEGRKVVFAAEIHHRSDAVADAMKARAALRSSRRSRNLRHRKPRFDNRRKPEGWLTPSMRSRLGNIINWVKKFESFCPIKTYSLEHVKFDTQKLRDPKIKGVEYQQGTLQGYEVREYLLEKWGRKCAYCGATKIPLEVEHIIPRSRHGSKRVDNLTLACKKCNTEKGSLTAVEFGHPEIQEKVKESLRDATEVSTMRWALWREFKDKSVELGTGGRTKFNRTKQQYPKTHWVDAACVGKTGEMVRLNPYQMFLEIFAKGRGSRKRCITDKYGFPVTIFKGGKRYKDWQTGDLAKAIIPEGKHKGKYVGRVSIRMRPQFQIRGVDVHMKFLRRVQRNDGYEYSEGAFGFKRT